MRVTTSLITQQAVQALLRSQEGMQTASRQVSSGLRLTQVSDAPGDAAAVMGANSELRALAQYKRTIAVTQAAMDRQEGALNGLTDLLSRARELATAQSGSTATAQTRAIAKSEVDQLLRQAVSLANTEHSGTFLFGGVESTTPPAAVVPGATLDFTITSAGATGAVEVASGVRVLAADSAATIFGDGASGPLAALRALGQALAANDATAVAAAGTALDGAFQRVQGVLGATGARSSQLASTQSNLEALNTTLRTYRGGLQDVEMEEAMSKLVAQQTTYQAAMAATSKMLDLNLSNYLR